MNNSFTDLQHTANILKRCLPSKIDFATIGKQNSLYLYVKPENVVKTIKFVKLNILTQCSILQDIQVVHWQNHNQLEISYVLTSVKFSSNLIVKTKISSTKPNLSLPSLSGEFSSANWLEREVYDMFGIFFLNHSDLRRILTDYGFKNNPLRKDFPLNGYVECRYSSTKKRVVTEPVEITQEFRQFSS